MSALVPDPERRRPALTLSEAAERCGVSRSTVRRRLDAGDFAHAWRDDGRDGPGTGPWMVPVSDLVGAGLDVTRPPDEPAREQGSEQGHETPPPGEPSGEVARLRAELAAAEHRAAIAEERATAARALADERAAALARADALLDTVRRMLPEHAAPHPDDPPVREQGAGHPPSAAEVLARSEPHTTGRTGRRWWERLTR